MNTNARYNTESQEDYRTRQKTDQQLLKILKRGFLIWNSREQGTYQKIKHGDLR